MVVTLVGTSSAYPVDETIKEHPVLVVPVKESIVLPDSQVSETQTKHLIRGDGGVAVVPYQGSQPDQLDGIITPDTNPSIPSAASSSDLETANTFWGGYGGYGGWGGGYYRRPYYGGYSGGWRRGWGGRGGWGGYGGYGGYGGWGGRGYGGWSGRGYGGGWSSGWYY